ncbi:hypothetical protein DFJ63DRAFT_327813 [Scheffersomyces coipomensis]|uniref:uncharacterized protein n=1 Tax=Scheffersomyces coipomensis TaxID=1788519 RepID=UPI00315C77DA
MLLKSVTFIPFILQLFYTIGVMGDVALYEPGTSEIYDSNVDSLQIPVKWLESNATPLLTQVTNYSLVLCNGTTYNINPVQNLTNSNTNGSLLVDGSYIFSAQLTNLDSLVSGSYFIQVLATGSNFYTIHYTNRFYIKDGNVQVDYDDLSQASPPAQTMFFGQGVSTVQSINTASYTVPYLLQTGSVRFAPMQEVPRSTPNPSRWTPTKTTTATPTKRPIYTKLGGYVKGKQIVPTVEYTVTQPPTYVQRTMTNTDSAAPYPSGYYDPKMRVQNPIKFTTKESNR